MRIELYCVHKVYFMLFKTQHFKTCPRSSVEKRLSEDGLCSLGNPGMLNTWIKREFQFERSDLSTDLWER